MNLNKSVQLIRGPKGSEVRLTVIPGSGDSSARKVVTLIRDEIPLEDSAAKAKLVELPNGRGGTLRLGLIDLPSFYAPFEPSASHGRTEAKSTSNDVRKLLTKLKEEKVDGVILDLRLNGGGSLEEAIKLTGLFIKDGPVVQVSDGNTVQHDDDTDPEVVYDGPLIVLTSRFSASASEILAGALQDYGRALIVGDSSTHGKGTVQSVNSLRQFMPPGRNGSTNDPGALKVTIKKFYRPSGVSTQLRGVIPDVILPSLISESEDFGERALKNALPCDTNAPAKFERLNQVAPYVEELRKRSTARLESEPEYRYVREDIARYKKQQADKTISLNLQQRLKEADENEARQKARDQERLAAKAPQETVYELSLKQAALPGLPAPMAKTNAVAKASSPHGLPGAGTVTASSGAGDGSEDGTDETKPPVPDAPMLEAEHILVDYLSVLKGTLASTTPTK
jgi:carboxyl-terminal processing protease